MGREVRREILERDPELLGDEGRRLLPDDHSGRIRVLPLNTLV